MKELIKELILDWQSTQWFSGTSRETQPAHVPNKATIIIGVRRAGKSTLMNQIAERHLQSGVLKENILYINFFDDRLSSLKNLGPDLIMQAYYGLYPQKKSTETVYCFFDEIQELPQWESFIDRLMRTEVVEIYLTGSSAQMLSSDIGTQMRGRALSWELFPFSFKEFTSRVGILNYPPFNTKDRLLLENKFQEYWHSGGFPEVYGLDKMLRVKIHQEYFNSIMFRDLVERHDVSHPKAMMELARYLLENIASLYSINNLTGFLKSMGFGLSKTLVAEYLNWFEDAYFLFTVRLFDASYRRSNANPKKIYCVDHAFVRSVTSGILVNSGHLLENIVFMQLRRHSNEVYYYKTNNGREIDFVQKDQYGRINLIQVCEAIVNPATRDRELSALEIAMEELKVDMSYLVTLNETEIVKLKNGMVEIIPLWKFLLVMDEKI
ncbi:MAG: ATP-binding protein [Bacteroidales bacterium]|nr:ATP-binding protein [Bacteroidales bacterium]